MDIIEQARLLGKAIQQSEQYKKFYDVKKQADEDEDLQKAIGQFNLLRIQLSEELNKEEKDQTKIDRLNDEMRSAYEQAMANEHMIAYNDAKTALDTAINNAKQIIDMSLLGEDPMTCEPASGCTGSCATCGGCH